MEALLPYSLVMDLYLPDRNYWEGRNFIPPRPGTAKACLGRSPRRSRAQVSLYESSGPGCDAGPGWMAFAVGAAAAPSPLLYPGWIWMILWYPGKSWQGFE